VRCTSTKKFGMTHVMLTTSPLFAYVNAKTTTLVILNKMLFKKLLKPYPEFGIQITKIILHRYEIRSRSLVA
jgi:L-lysine 2,3-aminomutase